MNFLKSPPVRSAALREAFRLIPCQNCGADDGTVCAAHSNLGVHGKAGALKASDERCCSLCFRCHGELDQGSRLTYDERRALWWRAHVKSIELLARRGLWPAGVPIPDTTMPEELPAHAPLTNTNTWEDPFQ